MKNCFDGYLTEDCKNCEWWRDSENQFGCAVPFQIMECGAFREKVESENDECESIEEYEYWR